MSREEAKRKETWKRKENDERDKNVGGIYSNLMKNIHKM